MRLPILALTAAAATASAATISFSNTATAAGNTTFVDFGLSKFDTTLGTLTGVTLTINEFSVQGSFTATNNLGDGTLAGFITTARLRQNAVNSLGFTAQEGTAEAGDNLTISPAPGVGYTLLQGVPQTFTLTELVFVSAASTNVDSSFWSAYQGSGNILFQLRNNPNATVSSGDGSFNTIAATSFADLTVTYTYTPAPIPEPSTYGAILGGLALVGAAIRRRRKSA